mgnify:CR=1 FL=1
MPAQVCAYRPSGACHSLDDARATHRPGGSPSVTLGFLLSSRNASQYHYAKWEERSRGTAALMRRAAAQLDFARGRPLDVWVHQHGQSAPVAVPGLGSCASSGRAWRLRAAWGICGERPGH